MNRTALVLMGLCVLLAGCSRTTPPPPGSKPAPAQTAVAQPPDTYLDFETQPLTQQHLDLYLSIMKEAVEKRQNLSDADKKVLADEADYYKHLKPGKQPPLSEAQQQLIKRANELHDIDREVAKSHGHEQLYLSVREAIGGMVGPMKCGDSDCGEGVPEDDPALRAKQIAADKVRKAFIKQDLVLLTPHEAEITALVKQIR